MLADTTNIPEVVKRRLELSYDKTESWEHYANKTVWLAYFRSRRQDTINSLYGGHFRDFELVSSLARVRNSGSLILSNLCSLFLPGN